jgi:hypothetical protein
MSFELQLAGKRFAVKVDDKLLEFLRDADSWQEVSRQWVNAP